MKTSVIYVDVESLFDIRQGLLGMSGLDVDQVSDYLLSEEYNFRETNDLKFLEPGSYKKAMVSPNIELLEASTITRILLSVKSKVDNIESRNKYYNETTVPEVLLNVYPFDLTEEQMTHIRDLLFFKLGSCVLVNVVRYNHKAVSPVFFKTSNVVSAFIFNVTEWLDTHTPTLQNTRIHDTIVYFPALYAEKPTEADLLKITKLGFRDPFSYTEYLLSTVASINFLPCVFYSNVITAISYLDKFDENLKNNFTKPEDEGQYDDILSKVQVP